MKQKNVLFKRFSPAVIFFGVALVLLADQVIKHKIRQNGGFYVCNQGISFGLLVHPFFFWLILGVFLLLSFLYFKYLTKKALLGQDVVLAFILVLGGALSNSVDRFFFGCIYDHIIPFSKKFPLFNLADIAIFLGSLLFIYHIYKKKTSKS